VVGGRPERVWIRRISGLFVPIDVARLPLAARAKASKIDLMPYAISTAPLLVPVVAISISGDPAILRVLLSQGDLVALFIGIMLTFLPLVVGSVVFVVIDQLSVSKKPRVVALAAASLLLIFTPVSLALVEFSLLAAFFTLIRPNRDKWFGRHRSLVVAAILVLGATTFGGFLWGRNASSISGSVAVGALYGLPREVAVEKDGEVWVYYLVASDDRFTTIITGNPKAVFSIGSDDIAVRLPCRHRDSGSDRSLFSLSVREQGGTAYCEDLATCLISEPQPDERYTRPVVDRCVRQAVPRS
jgi:hypothetical protein